MSYQLATSYNRTKMGPRPSSLCEFPTLRKRPRGNLIKVLIFPGRSPLPEEINANPAHGGQSNVTLKLSKVNALTEKHLETMRLQECP